MGGEKAAGEPDHQALNQIQRRTRFAYASKSSPNPARSARSSGATTDTGDVFAVDLNKDGADDFVVFLDGDEERINGMLLMSDGD